MLKQRTLDLVTFAAQTWLLEPETAAMLLAQLANGHTVLTLDDQEDPLHFADPNWVYYPAAKVAGSTAILTVRGVIYDYYVSYLVDKLQAVYADPNVSSLIVRGSSPGGSANAGYKLADTLAAAPFPTMGYIDYGQFASAGYMLGASCDMLYASRPNDQVGSIGTYIAYQDWSKYFEKAGVISKDIYAKQSSEKNLESRQAADGNFKLLQKMADDEATRFIDYVKARRPNIDTSQNDPFKGKIFSASDALSIGLIDGIGSLQNAVKALKSSSTSQNTTPRTTMLGYVKMTALTAVKGLEASAITDAQIEAINTELVAAGYNGLAVVSQAQLDAAVENANKGTSDATALATAQAEVTRLTTELNTEKSKVTTLTTERDTYKTQAETFGAQNGAQKTVVAKGAETQADAGENDADKVIAGLAHNKALEGTWLANLGTEAK